MQDRLIRLARLIHGRPWNQSGTDKTWVLRALVEYRRFLQEVKQAKRVRVD